MSDIPEQTPARATDGAHSSFADEQLMSMIQAHVHSGLALLYARHGALLKGLSMTVLHNDADADDLLQEVFMEIWDRAASYDPTKGKALSWIATLTRRRAIDRLRKRDTYCRVEDRFAEEAMSKTSAWTHVHEELAQGEVNGHLQRALATLPEAQRHAIRLAYYGRLSQRQIAVRTGTPLGTIKTRLELGLRKMAVVLRGLEDLLGGGRWLCANIPSRATANRGASTITS
jgi:RNA polymerase sigma-70 factor (ECF subfamily)